MAKWPYSTAEWQRLRTAKLSAQPLCEACLRIEIVEQANTVDHIVAIEKGGDPFPALSGLMSMCASCHNAKTMAKDGPAVGGFRRALRGFDADGNPVDGEGWDAPTALAGRPARGDSGWLGGLQSLEFQRSGPPAPIRTDLVTCESFATSKKEASLWV